MVLNDDRQFQFSGQRNQLYSQDYIHTSKAWHLGVFLECSRKHQNNHLIDQKRQNTFWENTIWDLIKRKYKSSCRFKPKLSILRNAFIDTFMKLHKMHHRIKCLKKKIDFRCGCDIFNHFN